MIDAVLQKKLKQKFSLSGSVIRRMSSEEKHTGSCICGGFKYEITGKVEILVNCHCNNCQKATGANVYSIFMVPMTRVKFTERSTIKLYESSATCRRFFCGRCGCSAWSVNACDPMTYYLCAGSFDGDPGIKTTGEIFVNYKKPWQQLDPNAPNSGEGELWETVIPK